MCEKKKAATVVETGDGGAQMVLHGFAAREHTAPAGRERGGIAALLLPGAARAVPLRELAALTGLEERAVRRAIQQERMAGVPILSDNVHGYYLPLSAAERDGCVRSMRHRAGQILAAADALAASSWSGEDGA